MNYTQSLGITLKEIRWKEGQKVLHNLPGQRGIRMDFYAVDTDNRIFNVEMQKRNQGNIPKRTRFYQGLVDAPLLKIGECGFDNLNPLCIVVICDFDLSGYGKYRYTFTNRCHEVEGLELGDESSKISQIKASEQMEAAYMKMEERDRIIREEAEHLGITKGRKLGVNQTISSFIESARKDGISDTDLQNMLQKYFQLSLEESEQLLYVHI